MNEQLNQLEQSVSKILECYRALKVENEALKAAVENARAEAQNIQAERDQLKSAQAAFEAEKAAREAQQAELAHRLDAIIGALQSGTEH